MELVGRCRRVLGLPSAPALRGLPRGRGGSVVVGIVPTHPNPTAEGWSPGPSEADRLADDRDGVPDLIRADNGLPYSGPDSWRGGLAGGPGFPP